MIRLIRTLMLLALALVLVKWTASGAVGPGSGGAPNVVTVAPGPGLTTMLANVANGTTLQLGDGTYTVTPSVLQSNLVNATQFSGAILANKTNITILGVPGQTIIDGSSSPGELLWITNCSNIRISGVTFLGWTNHNYNTWPLLSSSPLFAGINVFKTEKLLFENNSVIRHADHGIQDKGAEATGGVASDPPSTNQMIVRNCYFEDVGGLRTNVAGGFTSDGTACVITGWTVENCVFKSCLRGVEPYDENDAGGRVFRNTIVRNNQFFEMVDFAIGTAGSSNCHDALIEGNLFENPLAMTWHGTNFGAGNIFPTVGYNFNAGRGWRVRNNVARGGMYQGFYFANAASKLDDFQVTENAVYNISRGNGIGYGFWIGTGGSTVADSDSVRRMQFANNFAYLTDLAGFSIRNARDSVFENNVGSSANLYTSDNMAYATFWIGQANGTAVNLTNITFRNNRAATSVGTSYGYAIENNVQSMLFENNSLVGTWGFNGGITNRSTNAVTILGEPKTYGASVNLASIAANSAVDTVITAAGVTTNDAVSVQIPAQFWIGGAGAEVSYLAWATNSTPTDGQIVLRVINSDTTAATVDFPAVNMTFQARANRIHGQ